MNIIKRVILGISVMFATCCGATSGHQGSSVATVTNKKTAQQKTAEQKVAAQTIKQENVSLSEDETPNSSEGAEQFVLHPNEIINANLIQSICTRTVSLDSTFPVETINNNVRSEGQTFHLGDGGVLMAGMFWTENLDLHLLDEAAAKTVDKINVGDEAQLYEGEAFDGSPKVVLEIKHQYIRVILSVISSNVSKKAVSPLSFCSKEQLITLGERIVQQLPKRIPKPLPKPKTEERKVVVPEGISIDFGTIFTPDAATQACGKNVNLNKVMASMNTILGPAISVTRLFDFEENTGSLELSVFWSHNDLQFKENEKWKASFEIIPGVPSSLKNETMKMGLYEYEITELMFKYQSILFSFKLTNMAQGPTKDLCTTSQLQNLAKQSIFKLQKK